jgi:hypothetical protein
MDKDKRTQARENAMRQIEKQYGKSQWSHKAHASETLLVNV